MYNKPLVCDTKRFGKYFNAYEYKVSLKLPGIEYFRNVKTVDQFEKRLTQEIIDFAVDNDYYSGLLHQTTTPPLKPLWKSTAVKTITIFDKVTTYKFGHPEELRKYFSWYEHEKLRNSGFKVRVSSGCVDIYFNDMAAIALLPSELVEKINYTSNAKNYEFGKIYLKNPHYQCRIFLKRMKMDVATIKKFQKFLTSYDIKPCFSLKQRLRHTIDYIDNGSVSVRNSSLINRVRNSTQLGTFPIISDTNFIDCNNDTLTVLSLMYPELIKKVSHIEQNVFHILKKSDK